MNGHIILEFACRYFTPTSQADGRDVVPFGSGVDPDYILGSFADKGLVHLSDNDVEYYQRVPALKNGKRYVAAY